jgi:hypothetical protein
VFQPSAAALDFAEDTPARACQMKGLGSRFQAALNTSIAPTQSGMQATLPRRTA